MATRRQFKIDTPSQALDLEGVIAQRFDPAADIDSVRPHPRNVNQGDLGAIIESIRATGFHGALLIQESTGYIVCGNFRWRAAKALGYKRLPMIFGQMNDEVALRKLLADNRTGRLGSDDEAKLAALLQEIDREYGTLAGTGYDGDDLDELLVELGLAAGNQPPAPAFRPAMIKSGTIAELAPTEAERAILAGRKLLIEYSGGKDSSAAAIWARYYFRENHTELLFVDLGADFVGFHLYLHDAAKFLGAPLVILRSKQTVIEAMLSKGEWPHFLYPYCHENLHQPLDDYVRLHAPDAIAILRGGRLSERARTGKVNETRFLTVDRMKEYTYFQPLYFSDKDTSKKLLDEAGLPIWRGYECGLQRTACRICPGQRRVAYAAIRANFPEVWAELQELERRFGPGCWQGSDEAGNPPTFAEAADRGLSKFLEGQYAKR